jgi:hypothetical protein
MSDDEVVETIYGDHHKYTVIKKSGVFSTEYWIRRDDKPYKGSYKTLSAAVEAAKNEP